MEQWQHSDVKISKEPGLTSTTLTNSLNSALYLSDGIGKLSSRMYWRPCMAAIQLHLTPITP